MTTPPHSTHGLNIPHPTLSSQNPNRSPKSQESHKMPPSKPTEYAKIEQTIQANLPARHSVQREGGRGLGYGG